MLRQFFVILPAIILLCGKLTIAQQDDAQVLEQKITLKAENQAIPDILDRISKKTGVKFSYDPTAILSDTLLSFSFTDTKTGLILQTILGENHRFQVLKEQVIITGKTRAQIRIDSVTESAVPDSILRLAGIITDRKEGFLLSYVNISLRNSSIGTISNLDGEFELKIPVSYADDSITFSMLGYQKKALPVSRLYAGYMRIELQPVSIQIEEVKVIAIQPNEILDRMKNHISDNYESEPVLMTSFYREVIKQDKDYISVTEAVVEILKSAYSGTIREDNVRIVKGRRNLDVKPFQWVDFKLMGGPYYITKLDLIKTMESFIAPEYRHIYKYDIEEIIQFNNQPAFVLSFKPVRKCDFPCYRGKLYIDREGFALIKATFSLDKRSLKYATSSLIKKKPRNLKVKPFDVNYQVEYKFLNRKWHLNTARTSVKYHVRSRTEKVNSVFHSVTDLLISAMQEPSVKRFSRSDRFRSNDIFSELIPDFDTAFWGNYNIIKPDEDLRKALKSNQDK